MAKISLAFNSIPTKIVPCKTSAFSELYDVNFVSSACYCKLPRPDKTKNRVEGVRMTSLSIDERSVTYTIV